MGGKEGRKREIKRERASERERDLGLASLARGLGALPSFELFHCVECLVGLFVCVCVCMCVCVCVCPSIIRMCDMTHSYV